MALPADVADALTAYRERLGMFTDRLQWHAQVTSTNDLALAAADQGAPEGTVIAAEAQTAGRGRQGRTWSSPAGAGLYVSAILRPHDRAASLVTITAGVAIADGIRAATGLEVALKWPNDVYVGARKLAGILAEAGTSRTGAGHVVLGFGINVLPAAYPPDIAARATSLELELGRAVDRGLVLAACLAALAERYRQLTGAERDRVLGAWRAHAGPMLGRRVECVIGTRAVVGTAEGIDDQGALLVRREREVIRVISGEVSWQ
jgi:BirA family biotin operon repressor/biotin-[acetyl-CoA-carboxylase] ligase